MTSNIPPRSDGAQGGALAQPLTSDELLPPVEPPSAGFILQLFVIPAVIVAMVVLAWLAIESLARGGEKDPDAIVKALRSPNQARYQRAKELADMLRMPDRYQLNRNRELAQKLARYLDEMVEEGADAEAEVTMRYFLCTALGEFWVDDGAPALVKAAQRDPERDVRRRAINAIAVLADSLSKQKPPQFLDDDELADALVKLADDQDELIRSETAFALGVVGARPAADPRLAAELEDLADDPYTDARFNAAIGLARVGSPRAGAALVEMFDVESIDSSLEGEKPLTDEMTTGDLRAQKAYKRNTILHNAIKAVERGASQKTFSPEDRAALEKAMGAFLEKAPEIEDPAPVPRELLDAMKRTRGKLAAVAEAGPGQDPDR